MVQKVVVALTFPQCTFVVVDDGLYRKPAHPLGHVGQRLSFRLERLVGRVGQRIGQGDDIGIVVGGLVGLFEVIGPVGVGAGAKVGQVSAGLAPVEVAAMVAGELAGQQVFIHLLDVQVEALVPFVDEQRGEFGLRRGLQRPVGQHLGAELGQRAAHFGASALHPALLPEHR